jgi:hypothetical protein
MASTFKLPPDSEAAKFFNIEEFPDDPDLRVYHSRLRLLDEGYQHLEAYKGVGLVDPETPLPAVMEFALDVDGVIWVRISAYTLVVRKNTLFKWTDIDKELIELWIGIKAAMDLESFAAIPDTRPDKRP